MKAFEASVLSASEKILYEGEDDDEFDEVELNQGHQGEKSSTGGRSKYRSMDFSGSVFLIASNGQMLSLPIPSESKDDPLSWARSRRILVFSVLLMYGVVALFLIQTPGFLRGAFLLDFDEADMRPFTVSSLSGFPTFAMGVSFFVWIPLSVGFGRRLTLLSSAMMLTGATAAAWSAAGFYQLLISLAFIGFAVGASVSTILLVLVDISFIHERPLILAFYWGMSSVLPLLPLAQIPTLQDNDYGWRLVYGISIIPAAIFTIAIFLFVPETYFQRPAVAFDGRVVVQSATEKVKIYDEWNEVPTDNDTITTMQNIDDSLPPRLEDLPVHTWRVASLSIWARRVCEPKAVVACFIQIFLCLANPLVFWVTLLNALNFGGMMSIGTGFPAVMSQAPYNMSSRAIGQVSNAAALGSFLAWPASYFMLNNVMKRLTRRNMGIRHAEFYLPAFTLPIVTGAVSVFIYGVAAERKWAPVWYYVAYGMNSFSYTSGSIANTIWVTESLPQWAAPGLGVVGGVSYIASWGITASLPMWEDTWGVESINIGIGFLILVVGGLVIPIAFWGRSVRQFIDGKWGAYQAGALRPQPKRDETEDA